MSKEIKSLKDIARSIEFAGWCNSAIQEVFESLFEINQSVIPLENQNSQDLEISGVVAFLKDDIEALLQLSCSQDTMKNLVKATTDQSINFEQKILCIGEAVNIIFGILKEKMNSYDHNYEKCLPLVIVGHNHIILNLNRSDAFKMAYQTPFGIFNLKVGVGSKAIFKKTG